MHWLSGGLVHRSLCIPEAIVRRARLLEHAIVCGCVYHPLGAHRQVSFSIFSRVLLYRNHRDLARCAWQGIAPTPPLRQEDDSRVETAWYRGVDACLCLDRPHAIVAR